jgi:LysM repeat protein
MEPDQGRSSFSVNAGKGVNIMGSWVKKLVKKIPEKQLRQAGAVQAAPFIVKFLEENPDRVQAKGLTKADIEEIRKKTGAFDSRHILFTMEKTGLKVLPERSFNKMDGIFDQATSYILGVPSQAEYQARADISAQRAVEEQMARTTTPRIAGTYTIKRGDTLSKIAAAHGTTVQAIAQLNRISNVNLIRVGEQLVIPTSRAYLPPTTPAIQQVVTAPTGPLQRIPQVATTPGAMPAPTTGGLGALLSNPLFILAAAYAASKIL